MDILGDRFEIRRSLFDVVCLLRGERLCGGSVDDLGDRFVMRLGAIAV